MRLWNVNALAKDLAASRVSERDKLLFLLANLLFAAVMSELDKYRVVNPNAWHLTTSVLAIGIVAVGTVLCYRANKKGDGKHFMERYICLSVPVTIRLAFVLVCVLLLLYLAVPVLSGEEFRDGLSVHSSFISAVLLVISSALYYGWLVILLRRVSCRAAV
jgi:hypothetical protein